MIGSAFRRVDAIRACPAVDSGIIPASTVKLDLTILTAPDNHFVARPQCGVKPSRSRRARGAGSCPHVRASIVPAAGVKVS